MGVFNELQVGRFNRAFQKLTGIKGSPPVRQLGTEVLPVFSVPLGSEFRYLESWNRFGLGNIVPAAAGFNSAMQIRNPANSNVVLVTETIVISNANAGSADYRFSIQAGAVADLGTIIQPARLDARIGPISQQSALVWSQQNTAAIGALTLTFFQITMPATAIVNPFGGGSGFNGLGEITILPGDTVRFNVNAVNQSLNISLIVRERFLEDSERS